MADSPVEVRRNAIPAEQAKKALAILLGMAAHDLRTPLNAMAGWLQVLQSTPDASSPMHERALRGLRLAVAQQVMLADGLSQVAGVQDGHVQPESSAIDMGALLREAMAGLSEEASSRVVDLSLAEPAEPVHLIADGGLAQALIRHLLGAALRLASKKSSLIAGVTQSTVDKSCAIRVELDQAMITAAEIEILTQHAAGIGSVQPKGASAGFGLAVALHLLTFLRGSLQVVADDAPQHAILLVRFPPSSS